MRSASHVSEIFETVYEDYTNTKLDGWSTFHLVSQGRFATGNYDAKNEVDKKMTDMFDGLNSAHPVLSNSCKLFSSRGSFSLPLHPA